MIILGSCPGGVASNFWTSLFHGDLNLSLTMTLVSTVASFGMTSLWAYILGNPLIAEGSVKIPYHTIAISLASITIPLGLGILFKCKRPQAAQRMARLISKPLFIICQIAIPCLILTQASQHKKPLKVNSTIW